LFGTLDASLIPWEDRQVYIFALFIGFLNGLNLLISIIGDVYDEHSSEQELKEVQVLLWLTYDSVTFVNFILWPFGLKENSKYVHTCSNELLDEQADQNWDGKVK